MKRIVLTAIAAIAFGPLALTTQADAGACREINCFPPPCNPATSNCPNYGPSPVVTPPLSGHEKPGTQAHR